MTETRTGFEAPELRRLRYFHGQLLGARDFQREQEYFREKLKLRMRCLLGYGVVCGLLVEAVPGDHDDDKGEAAPPAPASEEGAPAPATDTEPRTRKAKVRLTPGLGVDACGNEIVVRGECEVDLWKVLTADDNAAAARTEVDTVWVGVEYCEQAVEPTRTVFTSGCADTSDCEFGWTQEIFKIRVTAERPDRDRRCDTCCDGADCADCDNPLPIHHPTTPPTLWLARIDNIDWYRPVRPEQIDLGIRRPFGRRVPTVITGINWKHGHTYTVAEAKELLGTTDDKGGLVVHFSDDVRVDGLRPGVVDIQVIEGGAGKEAGSWFMGAEFKDVPNAEFAEQFRYRQTTRETLQDGDRVHITVRTAFLLDRCCRPVDGTHVGGRVPYVGRRRDAEEDRHGDDDGCRVPPSGVGPWTSGNGVGGDVFESWFFVREG